MLPGLEEISIKNASSIGWGSEIVVRSNDKIISFITKMCDRLKKIRVQVELNSDCQKWYSDRILSNNHICTIGIKKIQKITVVIKLTK